MAFARQSSNLLPSQIALIKTRLATLDDSTLEQLRNVYEHRLVETQLRSTGWLNLFLSGLTLWLGSRGARYSANTFSDLQILFGTFTLLISLWAIIHPSLPGVRAFAAAFLIAAVWNFSICVQDISNGYGVSLLLLLLACAQVRWAYQYNRLYQKNRFLETPTAAFFEEYDQILKALHRANPKTDTDMVEFKFYYNRWRGWLLGNTAVFGIKKRKVFLVTRGDNVTLRPYLADFGTKKQIDIHVRIDNFSTRGVISLSNFDIYRQWKLQNNPGQSPEALELVGTAKNSWIPFSYLHPLVRIPVLIAGLIVLLMVLFTLCTFVMYMGYS